MDSEGRLMVRLNFDHRIFDGALAARVLARLEQMLNSAILEELRGLAPAEALVQPRRA
jgi:pyruvate/2-oxoglutarate dehydrogenase complex dihydrolipoamide acyltransferase (E2) component